MLKKLACRIGVVQGLGFCATLFSLLFVGCSTPDRVNMRAPEEGAEIQTPQEDAYGILSEDYLVDTVRVPFGDPLAVFLRDNGVQPSALAQLGLALDSVLSPRKFKAGKETLFYRNADSSVAWWVYRHAPTEYVKMDFRGDTVRASYDTLAIRRVRSFAHVRIESSLWNAMVAAGAKPNLALDLSDIFAWTVDFFGLGKGDEFFVVYDREYVDSTLIGTGTIWTARYVHGEDTVSAYRFMQDSVWTYWDKGGNSLRKAFLKAPLHFSRISSHFSYARRHPILKIVRPHTGVDYAAPMGTPVMALGDGVVIARAYQRGGGNYVKIRHNSVYTTAYLHLSKFGKGIKPGVRVQQGQVIGYVGMTGYATGPHLDFRVWKNGKPVNPLKIESPSVAPIKEENREAFLRAVEEQNRGLAEVE